MEEKKHPLKSIGLFTSRSPRQKQTLRVFAIHASTSYVSESAKQRIFNHTHFRVLRSSARFQIPVVQTLVCICFLYIFPFSVLPLATYLVPVVFPVPISMFCNLQSNRHTKPNIIFFSNFKVIRLSALIDLYIYPLKGIFHPSHHKIYSFSASIHPLYHPLSTVGSTYHFI
jgi:hypothetical protein